MIMYKKQCDCDSTASGPRFATESGDIRENEQGEEFVTIEIKYLEFACDKCDTPFKRVKDNE